MKALYSNQVESSQLNRTLLPFPSRLVHDFLDRRQQVFQDAARAEMDLGVHLHARQQRETRAIALDVTAVQRHQHPVEQRRTHGFAFCQGARGVAGDARIRADPAQSKY